MEDRPADIIGVNDSALDLPCKLVWGVNRASEARGVAVQLSSAAALAVLEFGEYVPVPPVGTTVELEVLLPECGDDVPKCLQANGAIEWANDIIAGAQVIACRLHKTNFKDCTDAAWLARVGAIPIWTM